MSPHGDDLRHARRVPPLQGGQNFRDLGGYLTEDGRRVRWGRLYRSGTMGGLTDVDCRHLATLGIRSVCDLRTPEERQDDPNGWAAEAGIDYWCRDYVSSFGELHRLMASGLATEEDARAAMIAGYRRLPREQAPAHRAVFERLRNGAVPLVFNCTAGKDRTGTLAALVLSALGVPRETIVADYRLTDEVRDYRRIIAKYAAREGSLVGRISPEVHAAVLVTHPTYIGAALDVIVEEHGSMEAYFRDMLTLDEAGLHAIRTHLLE